MTENTGWRAFIPALSPRDVRILDDCERFGSTPNELVAMAQNAALEHRFQTDCDRLYADTATPVEAVAHSEWWPPGEGHEMTYRYVTLTSAAPIQPLTINVVAEVEVLGAMTAPRIELTVAEVSTGLSPATATAQLTAQTARLTAAHLNAVADQIEGAA
ncbi:hypothetical protein KXR83_04895 [Williamsia muralis]|uniref:hypothetical protein n=1 Tax=Williamsia marianensis TaxID=85044 RepID=UPI003F1490E8